MKVRDSLFVDHTLGALLTFIHKILSAVSLLSQLMSCR